MTPEEYGRLEALLRVPSISAMPEHAADMAVAASMIAASAVSCGVISIRPS